ncbi:MAG: rod shape-determining protein MreC [Gammaproteobacteria bacterium]|nr:MAG: rod shape-determining protein MreC [Gammaproteobacteria bacterium]
MAGLKPTDVLPGRGPALGTRLFLLLACSILLMVLDSREDYLQYIHSKLNIVVYPIQAAVDLPFALADWVSTSLASRRQLLAENRDLRRQQLRSDASVQKMIAIEAENARLRALMDTAALMTDRTMVTEIMAIDLNPYRRLLTINKGSSAGAYRGQALVDAFGIVGQISDLGPLSSQVLLISDPEHAVPVEVNRNGLRTIAVGTGDAQILNLPFLPNNADIRLGDLLVTSGLGGVFPAGYPVAEVNQIEVNPSQPFAHVEAAPAAELDKVRELLLIWPGGVQD